jgi:hypothetical protein
MLGNKLRPTSRLLAGQPKYRTALWQVQQAVKRGMSCATAITVAFKSPAQQQEFASSFKLVSRHTSFTLPMHTSAAAQACQCMCCLQLNEPSEQHIKRFSM